MFMLIIRALSSAFLCSYAHSFVACLLQIIVLDGGKIVERGSHEKLLQLDGYYAKLWNMQVRSSSGDLDGHSPISTLRAGHEEEKFDIL